MTLKKTPNDDEVKQRWGNTKEFKQSEERVKKMGPAGLHSVQEAQGKLLLEIASVMDQPPESTVVQSLIDQHYHGLESFYDPSIELYRGLAEMYIADPRFKKFFEKIKPGLALFMHQAMLTYVHRHGLTEAQ